MGTCLPLRGSDRPIEYDIFGFNGVSDDLRYDNDQEFDQDRRSQACD